MAILVINRAGQDLCLRSINLTLSRGQRLELSCSEDDLLIICPELNRLRGKGLIFLAEDVEILEEVKIPRSNRKQTTAIVKYNGVR